MSRSQDCSGCARTGDGGVCPPRMADGRAFTDYRPHCRILEDYRAMAGRPTSFELRQFLTNNGVKLTDRMASDSFLRATCGMCFDDSTDGTALPHLDSEQCSAQGVCEVVPTGAPHGLGRMRRDTASGTPQPRLYPITGVQVDSSYAAPL
jgi:hypothetical protein